MRSLTNFLFQEEDLRTSNDPKYQHLHEELHVEITAFAPPAEAHARVAYALTEVRKYLIPDSNDEIRQEQMREMEILAANGGDPLSIAAAMAAAAAASDPLKRAALTAAAAGLRPVVSSAGATAAAGGSPNLSLHNQAAAVLRPGAANATSLSSLASRVPAMPAMSAAASPYLATGVPLVRSGLPQQQKLYGDELSGLEAAAAAAAAADVPKDAGR